MVKVIAKISTVRLTNGRVYDVICELPDVKPTHYRIKDDKGELKTFNMNLFEKGSANDE